MKKMKITLAAIALIATVGITSVSAAMAKARVADCSEFPFGQGRQVEKAKCLPGPDTCCYLLSDNTPWPGLFPM